MSAVTELTFRKGERRKYPGWRAFTVVTGNITRAGVMVEFDPDPINGQPGGRQFADTQWVAQAEAIA